MRSKTLAALVLSAAATPWSAAIDDEHRERGAAIAARAVEWLRAQQDRSTGGWSVRPEGPQFPAITGLVVTGMLMEPGIDGSDPAIRRAVDYILSFRKPDGGIYDNVLPNYNTAICLSALARLGAPMPGVVQPAQRFLRSLQWCEDAGTEGVAATEAQRVGPEHPFYGGVGYGRQGRPDNSNLGLMLQALHDSGVPASDEAFQRAVVFLSRTQMLGQTNDQPFAAGSRQGGFIYSVARDQQSIGEGENEGAGRVEETLDTGEVVSRLRAYGSMTYAGFKSYIYADLPPNDQRVRAAEDWIRRHYTLAENPGLGTDGFYYYLLTFSRAMDAAGRRGGGERRDAVTIVGPDGQEQERDWANDLIDRLAELQEADGSFRVVGNRWMEDNPVLITAYALIAAQQAAR